MNLEKRGFTLIEVLVTIVILGVVAGLAVPSYTGAVEKSRENEAQVLLNVIHMGQKIYYLNNSTYWPPAGNLADATAAAINAALAVDIAPVYYTDIDFSGVSNAGYTVVVTRAAPGTRWFQNVWVRATNSLTTTNGG